MIPNYFDSLNPEIKSVPEPDYQDRATPPPIPEHHNDSQEDGGGNNNQKIDDYFDKISQPDPWKPMSFDWQKSNADLFTKDTAKMASLGFKPEMGTQYNEQNYAKQQGTWAVLGDTLGKFGVGVLKTGYDLFKSWSNFGDMVNHKDLQAPFYAEELDRINEENMKWNNFMHVYQTAAPDSFNWRSLAKEVQGIAPIVGLIGEMALEDYAVTTIAGATFGLLAPVAAITIAKNARAAQRLLKVIDADANYAKVYNSFKSSEGAANAWDVAKAWSQAKIAPTLSSEATRFIPIVGNTLQSVGRGMVEGREVGIAQKMFQGFHAFYSDAKNLNLGINMGQSSAAGIYQTMIEKNTEDFRKQNGRDPNFEENLNIKENSQLAAKKDGTINSIAAVVLNNISFDNIFTSNKFLRESLANQGMDVMERLHVNPLAKPGEPMLTFKKEGWAGFKQTLGSLEFHKDNAIHGLSFGVQMITQSGIDKMVESYYDARYNHRNMSWTQAVEQGIDSQFTKEGAKTFMSGFLTGAIALGVGGKLIGAGYKSGISGLVDRFGGEEGKANREDANNDTNKRAQSFIDEVENIRKNPFSEPFLNVITQTDLSRGILEQTAKGNKKEAIDHQSDSMLTLLTSLSHAGLVDVWTDEIKSKMEGLSKEDQFKLLTNNDRPFEQKEYENMQKNLNFFYGSAKDFTKTNKDILTKFPNPHNPFRFKAGTIEREISMNQYNDYKEAVGLISYLKASAMNVIERKNKLLNDSGFNTGISNIESFKNVPATFIDAITSPEKMEEYLTNLQKQNIELKKLNPTGDALTDLKKSEEEHRVVSKYYEHVASFQHSYGEFKKIEDPIKQQEKIDSLTKGFKESLANILGPVVNLHLKSVGKDAASIDDINKGVDKFLDYYKLNVDHEKLNAAVNTVLDPTGFDALQKAFGTALKNKLKTISEQKEEPIKNTENKPKEKTPLQKQHLDLLIEHITDSKEAVKKFNNNHEVITKIIEEKTTKLNDTVKEIEDISKDLKLKLKDKTISDIDIKKIKDNLENAREVFNSELRIKDAFEEQKKNLENLIETVDKYKKYVDTWEWSAKDENIDKYDYSDIDGELKTNKERISGFEENINKAKEMVSEIKKYLTKSQFLTSARVLNKEGVIDIFKTLRSAKTLSECKPLLEKIISDESIKNLKDNQTLHYAELLKDKIDNDGVTTREDLLNKLHEPLQKELDNTYKLLHDVKQLSSAQDHILELEKNLTGLTETHRYLEHLVETKLFDKTEGPTDKLSKLIPDIKFPEDLEPEEPDTSSGGDRFDGPDASEKSFKHRQFLEDGLKKTMGRSHQPAHIDIPEIKDIDGNNAKISLSVFRNKDGNIDLKFELLDKKRYSPKTIKELSGVISQIENSYKNLTELPETISVFLGGTSKELKLHTNDKVVTESEGNDRLALAMVDLDLSSTREGTHTPFLQTHIENSENPLLESKTDPTAIKVAVVNDKGEYLDKDGRVIEKPTKDNIVYSSIPNDEILVGGNLLDANDSHVNDLINQIKQYIISGNDKKIFGTYENLPYLIKMFEHISPENGEHLNDYLQEVREEIVNYRKLINAIKTSHSSGVPLLLKIKGKSTGIPARERVDKNLSTEEVHNKFTIVGRLTKANSEKNDPNYSTIIHMNGRTATITIENNGSINLTLEDGNTQMKLPMNTRKLLLEEQSLIYQTLKNISEINKNSLRTEEEKQSKNNLVDYLKAITRFKYLKDSDISVLKGIDEKTIKNILPKNMFGMDNDGKLYFYENNVRNMNVIDFQTNPEKLIDILETSNINLSKKMFENNKSFRTPIFDESEKLKDFENPQNYRKFAVEDVLISNVIKYGEVKDPNGREMPQIKSSALLFDISKSQLDVTNIESKEPVKNPSEPVEQPTTDISSKIAELEKQRENEYKSIESKYDDDDGTTYRVKGSLRGWHNDFSSAKKEINDKYDKQIAELQPSTKSVETKSSENNIKIVEDLSNNKNTKSESMSDEDAYNDILGDLNLTSENKSLYNTTVDSKLTVTTVNKNKPESLNNCTL